MKILADAHIGRGITDYLRSLGHDVLHVRERSKRMFDSGVLKLAEAEQRIVITADKDFGALIFHRVIPAVGVLLIRYHARTERERLQYLIRDWPQIEKIVATRMVVATNSRLRYLALP